MKFRLVWNNGESDVFSSNCEPSNVEDTIAEIRENINNYSVSDVLDRLEELGFKVNKVRFTDFEF